MGVRALTGAGVEVRPARAGDAEEVRRLVAQALLAAGFGPPDPDRDADLATFDYYDGPGRAAWVAVAPGGQVVGFAALDRTDDDIALLRRLVGDGLDALLEAALDHARERGCSAVEAVMPAALEGPRRAAEEAGFGPLNPGNDLLLRISLRPGA